MENEKLHVIAEAGVNHNGSYQNAEKLIDIAADCGADSVKFQIINPWGLYLPGDYKYGHYDIKKVIANRQSTVLSDEEYRKLASHCRTKNIAFSSSIFDKKGLELLSSLNPPFIKIASSDLTNIRLLRMVADTGHRVILSTGMATLQEIEKSVKAMTKNGFEKLILMHCVSVYPCPVDKSNVAMVKTLKDEFGYPVGFSDHTRTNEASIGAYALGARWFEKHYTYDNNLEGFDHKHAQNIEEFTNYIAALRAMEISFAKTDMKLSDEEKYTAERARRSLYASRDIAAGEVITSEDILCVRPSNTMNPNEIDLIIGKKLNQELKAHEPFSLNYF